MPCCILCTHFIWRDGTRSTLARAATSNNIHHQTRSLLLNKRFASTVCAPCAQYTAAGFFVSFVLFNHFDCINRKIENFANDRRDIRIETWNMIQQLIGNVKRETKRHEALAHWSHSYVYGSFVLGEWTRIAATGHAQFVCAFVFLPFTAVQLLPAHNQFKLACLWHFNWKDICARFVAAAFDRLFRKRYPLPTSLMVASPDALRLAVGTARANLWRFQRYN